MERVQANIIAFRCGIVEAAFAGGGERCRVRHTATQDCLQPRLSVAAGRSGAAARSVHGKLKILRIAV
jgi:hypothetical protein